MIEKTRITHLNKYAPAVGEFVLYWMQASQRAEYNHALEYAISQANELEQPLVVYFGLTGDFPEANERHYHFMLEGLQEVQEILYSRGIGMVIECISPEKGITRFAQKASLVVCDRGYLKIQKQWRQDAADLINCPLVQVESDVIVPVEEASKKEEYSAATLRRKLLPALNNYLLPFTQETPQVDSTKLKFDTLDISNLENVISLLEIDRSVRPVDRFHGGTGEAKRRLDEFVNTKLDKYEEFRNDPDEDCQSNLSPYLHFGQISPLYIALEVIQHGSPGMESFLEELINRRELSMNFVHYNPDYDSFSGLPEWAERTLLEHKKDSREYIYSRNDLEQANTHDPYWNAAQAEMMINGKMHGYMRMYWGKKILEWTASPEEAFDTAIYLNNKYELDGRDPNSFTGVAWCFGKHDRPWAGRSIFGNVRYMSAGGLKRKFNIDRYVEKHNLNGSKS